MAATDTMQCLSATARQVLPPDGEAYLFGSRARGTAHSDSDWDVLVLIDGERPSLDYYSLYAHPFRELGWNIGENISPIILTKSQWEKASFTPFYKNVMQDRKRL